MQPGWRVNCISVRETSLFTCIQLKLATAEWCNSIKFIGLYRRRIASCMQTSTVLPDARNRDRWHYELFSVEGNE